MKNFNSSHSQVVRQLIIERFTNFQDHLELFFGSIRMALGANNNPSCHQFMSIFKKLLMKLEIRSAQGNCLSQDATTLLTVSSSKPAPKVQAPTEELSFINRTVEEDLQDEELVNGFYYLDVSFYCVLQGQLKHTNIWLLLQNASYSGDFKIFNLFTS